MQFQFEAMSPEGGVISDTLEAATQAEAAAELRKRGLMVIKLAQRSAAGVAAAAVAAGTTGGGRRVNMNDLVLFCRQMKMLLSSGSDLVTALEASQQQAVKPAVRRLVDELREYVEGGGSLTEAMQARPDVFPPIFCTMVAAGEETAGLPMAFDQLSQLASRQAQMRKAIVGALTYPAILSLMCLGVVALMIGFVVPRFRKLFANLNMEMPLPTQIMFGLAAWLEVWWPVVLGVFVALVVAAALWLRLPQFKDARARVLLRVPGIGGLAARLQLARVLRVWTAMLRSNVLLIDTIEQSKAAVSNIVFLELLDALQESVSSGGQIGDALGRGGFIPPVVASAVRTGEQNGKLPEAVEFVSNWMDDENQQMLTSLTRYAEPALLAVMGLVVGLVAMSLFMPLFDMATAG